MLNEYFLDPLYLKQYQRYFYLFTCSSEHLRCISIIKFSMHRNTVFPSCQPWKAWSCCSLKPWCFNNLQEEHTGKEVNTKLSQFTLHMENVLSLVLLGRAAECLTKISGGKICAINYIKSLEKKKNRARSWGSLAFEFITHLLFNDHIKIWDFAGVYVIMLAACFNDTSRTYHMTVLALLNAVTAHQVKQCSQSNRTEHGSLWGRLLNKTLCQSSSAVVLPTRVLALWRLQGHRHTRSIWTHQAWKAAQ